MKKIAHIVIVVTMILAAAASVPAVTTADTYTAGPDNTIKYPGFPASSVVHIDYVELDEYLDIVEHGASGKMTYHEDTGVFVFNGHGLDPGVHYALIARSGGTGHAIWIILGDSVAGDDGNLHLAGTVDLDALYDEGASTLLVLYDDLEWFHETDGTLSGWLLRYNHPTEYLFGQSDLWK